MVRSVLSRRGIPYMRTWRGFQKIGSLFRASTNWKDRSLAVFGPPEWSPLALEPDIETRDSLYGQAPQIPSSTLTYVLTHFTFTTAWLLYWLSGTSDANVVVNVALAASVVTGLWSWGALLEGHGVSGELLGGRSVRYAWGRECHQRIINVCLRIVHYGLWTLFSHQRRFEREQGLEKAPDRP